MDPWWKGFFVGFGLALVVVGGLLSTVSVHPIGSWLCVGP